MEHGLHGINRRGKLLVGFAVFLIFMWVCTIISKSIYISMIPVVRTVTPQEKYIEHTIEADGVVTGGGEQAICTLEGILVEQVCVKAGDKVQQGDTLLTLDKEDLQQQIKNQKWEIAKLNAEVNELTVNQEISQQKKEEEIQRGQEDYNTLNAELQRQVERAERERNEALTALTKHTETQPSVTENEDWIATKEALEDALQVAEDALQDAQYAKQNGLKDQERVVADAQTTELSSSQLEQSRISLQMLQEQVAGYENLMKQDGIITAPSEGSIIRVAAATGERTTDTAAVLMTRVGASCQFRLTIPKQQKDYVKVGDSMTVQFTKDGTEQEAQVAQLVQNETDTDYLDVYLDLPQGIGQPQELGSVKKSVQGELKSDCIPMEAVHKQDNRYYVYLLQEREGILGMEQYVEELTVRVEDQNDRYAAIETGILPSQAAVIVHGSRELSVGEVVRAQSQE